MGRFVVGIVVLALLFNSAGAAYATRNGWHTIVQVYQSHARIEIHGNSDFAGQASAGGWPGTGSQSNPYIIQGYSITSDWSSCIEIWGTTVYFRILNCLLTITSDSGTCISMYSLMNGLIEHCTLISSGAGIDVYSLQNCVVRNNVVQGSRVAVYLSTCSSCTFENNVFKDGGIALWPMDPSELTKQLCEQHCYGKSPPVLSECHRCDHIRRGLRSDYSCRMY